MDKTNHLHLGLFFPSLRGGGAERVMVTLANGFAARGVQVDLIVAKAEGPYLSEVSKDIRIVDLKTKAVLPALFPLIQYLKHEHPAVLLSTSEHGNIIALWAKMLSGGKTKCIIRVPNTLGVSTRYSGSLRDRIIPWCLKMFSAWADAIVVVSKASAKDLLGFLHVSPSQVHVIYNPVVHDALFEKAAMPLDHPWFVLGEPPVILGVGRLSRQKDFSTLIKAFFLLRKERSARLMILGEGEERKKLEALITELEIQKDVSLQGFVDNPFPYMKKATVFALSSRWEGLPNVLIQAMALGAPAVATDCPGGSAEILQGLNAGILVPVGDEKAMFNALMKNLNCGSIKEELNLASFQADEIIRQYLDLIGMCLGKDRGNNDPIA